MAEDSADTERASIMKTIKLYAALVKAFNGFFENGRAYFFCDDDRRAFQLAWARIQNQR
jgi:hypothetical protein